MGAFLIKLPLSRHDQLSHCQECQERLLAMVVHDLKSPLSLILGVAENLLLTLQRTSGGVEAAEIEDGLAIISNMGAGMAQLIDGLLSSARMESGKEFLELQEVNDLADVFLAITEVFQVEARRRDIVLRCHIESALPVVYWDMCRIQYHVLNNIIANALKYTHKGGLVELRVYARPEQVVVEIADNGPGIPHKDREKIFHPFERLGVKAERAYQSAGLGLYNAYLLTRQHDGMIRVDDGLNGSGARFVITLPVRPYRQ